MSTNSTSTNPVVQAIVSGKAPAHARLAAARGLLPLAQDDLVEVLVSLRSDEDADISAAAEATLGEQEAGVLAGIASSPASSPAVLTYLAGRPGTAREVQEAVALNPQTPDEAVAALALNAADGSVLEVIAINQQRLPRAHARGRAARARDAARVLREGARRQAGRRRDARPRHERRRRVRRGRRVGRRRPRRQPRRPLAHRRAHRSLRFGHRRLVAPLRALRGAARRDLRAARRQ